ncbi:MAG: hypothetical protein ACT443_11030 [Gemmatimonadota bacterium]
MTTPLLLAMMLATAQQQQQPVPLYPNLGNHHHPISTEVPKAQQYFDQGLRLAYGFNQEESIRSFREAARLDPKCAICWWGVAYGYGPNVNLPMDSVANAAGWDAISLAKALLLNASASERDYILALEQRYGPNAGPAGDSAYMRAAQALAQKYPDDSRRRCRRRRCRARSGSPLLPYTLRPSSVIAER